MRITPISSKIAAELKKVEKAKKVDTTNKIKATLKPDTLKFSPDAKRLSETSAGVDIVSAQMAGEPEIRTEKVEEVRKKIDNGFYNSPEFIDKLAEKLLSFFGISNSEK